MLEKIVVTDRVDNQNLFSLLFLFTKTMSSLTPTILDPSCGVRHIIVALLDLILLFPFTRSSN